MPDPTAQAMEDARRRNIMAPELAMKPAVYKTELLPRRAFIEVKVDGIGLLDVDGTVQSHEGVPFDCASHLFQELASIRRYFDSPVVLHGEYLEAGGFNAALSAFQSGVGSGAVILWDAIPLKAWHGYELCRPLIDRKSDLEMAMELARPRMISWMRVPLLADPTDELVQVAAETAWAGGQEGLVVKDADSPYWRGTSPYWLKVKQVETIDVPIQSLRLEGVRLKSLVVTVEGKPAVVPTGFSELQRLQLDEFRPGRIVEISHVGKTPGGALKGARFIRFRDDKESSR